MVTYPVSTYTQLMAAQHTKRNPKSGFALIVVLSGLVILTALFAVTSSRTQSQLNITLTNEHLLRNQHTRLELLNYALSFDKKSLVVSQLPDPAFEINGTTFEIRLQDVGGLIDLNTGSVEIVERLLESVGFSRDAAERFVTWRNMPNRLQRVSDILTVIETGYEHYDLLLFVATIHSGRSGISPDHTPAQLEELLLDGGPIIQDWRTKPSGVNFNVIVTSSENENDWLLGTVHFGPGKALNKILWING